MRKKLIAVLESFEIPVILQGTLAQSEEYPKLFFTFWENPSAKNGAYDNKTFATEYDFDVNCYGVDEEEVEETLQEAIKRLEEEGFLPQGEEYDIASDEVTHVGKGVNIKAIKY